MKKEEKKYFALEEKDNCIYLNEKGYWKIHKGGVFFKTNGFEKYANENGIIFRPNLVSYSLFKYDHFLPFKQYFISNHKINVNTRVMIVKEKGNRDGVIPANEEVFIYLTWVEKLRLAYCFRKMLVQKSNFWMWVINVVVALGATIAGFLIVFS